MIGAETQTLRVRFYATLRALVGGKQLELALPPGTTVHDLARALAELHPELAEHFFDEQGEIGRRVHFMIDGRSTRWLPDGARTVLASENEIDVFPPAAGG
jgi:molybdopterin synthase sulfur carrier subunit